MFPRCFREVRRLGLLATLVALLVPIARAGEATADTSALNQLTPAEQQAGWRLLFDGQSLKGWRGYKLAGLPEKGWSVEGGCIKHAKQGGGGDLITEATYGDFELTFEWRIGPKANSGVKYFVSEDHPQAIGHEYQLIDDAGLGFAKPGDKHQTASFYDVLAATAWKEPNPPGQFNQTRIVVQKGHVEHWLNGLKTLEYELGSPAVREAVAKSKFRDIAGFATEARGHLLLQDHGGEVCFRNLKLRELGPAK